MKSTKLYSALRREPATTAPLPGPARSMAGWPAVDMPTSTTFELPGYRVERTLGLFWELIVRSVGLTKG
jgi:hypothetical protein